MGCSLVLDNAKDFVLTFDVKFVSNGSVSVVLETTEKGPPYIIHYITSPMLLSLKTERSSTASALEPPGVPSVEI